jgi:hypothetical protein
MNIIQPLESNFLKALKENICILQVGTKHSGKTVTACVLIRHLLLEDNFYNEFHLVLPSYDNQAKGTFDWLDKLPKKAQNKITIYESFSMVIIDDLIEKADGKKNRFLYVDDATAEQAFFSNSEQLKALSTRCRHLKITAFLCFHYLRRSLTPQLRNSCEFLMLHRVCDEKLLTSIWEESISLFMPKEQFLSICRTEMLKDYPCICLWKDKVKMDIGCMEWKFQAEHRPFIIKNNSKTREHNNTIVKKNAEDKTFQSEIDTSGSDPTTDGRQSQVEKGPSRKVLGSFGKSIKR